MRIRIIKLISMTLALSLTLALLPVFSTTAYAASITPSGTGTESDPYLIAEQGNLEWLAANLSSSAGKFYRQTEDIALTGSWTPIGYSTPFAGTYDGYGHTISGISITSLTRSTEYAYFGLFGQNRGTIKNLTVTGCIDYTNSSITSVSNAYAGIIAAANDGIIDNCEAKYEASIDATNAVNLYVGHTSNGTPYRVCSAGIAGVNRGTIQNCRFTGGKISTRMRNNANGSCYAMSGGIVAQNTASGIVLNCYVNPNIKLYSYAYSYYASGTYARGCSGGIAAINSGIVKNVYSIAESSDFTGDSSNNYFGEVIGRQETGGESQWLYNGNWKNIGEKNGTIADAYGGYTGSDIHSSLNANIDSNTSEFSGYQKWYLDETNGGYPVLKMGGIVTYDKQGGEGETPDRFIVGGLRAIEPSVPTREGYTFGGWHKEADCINEWSFADDTVTADTILYAKWTLITKITEVNDTTTDSAFTVVKQSNLDEVFDHVVTSADVTGDNIVTLSLNVSDIAEQNTDTEAIKAIANNTGEVYFFDVTLKKSVNDGMLTTNTVLTNVPVPVEVHIKLDGELAGRTYYRVYRYHDGKAEQISSDTSRAEHYTVDVSASEIIIRTMKFSTYAIFGNDAPIDLGTGYDVDVQAKITGTGGAVYKIDLAWGAMTFEYSTSGVWDADTHSYNTSETVGWLKEGFMNGNNQITAWNHSNGDVEANFTITQPSLTGVTMEINRSNVLGGTAAVDMELVRVPNEGESAKSIDAFLLLDGEPDDVANVLNANYSKIAVITVTIEAVAGSQLTPKTP